MSEMSESKRPAFLFVNPKLQFTRGGEIDDNMLNNILRRDYESQKQLENIIRNLKKSYVITEEQQTRIDERINELPITRGGRAKRSRATRRFRNRRNRRKRRSCKGKKNY